MILERTATEGKSPVGKSFETLGDHLSTAGHGKSCGKSRRPLRKAKYSLATDSELVP